MNTETLKPWMENVLNGLLGTLLIGSAGAGLGGLLWGAVSAFNIAVHWIPVDEWRPFVGAL